MKLFPYFLLVALAGCSSAPAPRPSAEVGMTAQQKIDKIQNDPTMEAGLKQIKIETIKREAGIKP